MESRESRMESRESRGKQGRKQPVNQLLAEKYQEWRPEMSSYFVQNNNFMRWSDKQNRIYCQFLKDNLQTFNDREIRRKKKMYLTLSKKLRRRTVFQVKSHHQKMMKKYKTIDNIIAQMELGLAAADEQWAKHGHESTVTATDTAGRFPAEQLEEDDRFLTLKQEKDLDEGILQLYFVDSDNADFDWFKDQ